MKTTIDLPDNLHRKIKSKAALERRSISDVARELFEGYVMQAVFEVEESHMEDDVKVVDKAKLLAATLHGKPIIKGIYPTGTAVGQADAANIEDDGVEQR